MSERPPRATHEHAAARLDESLEFLKRTRSELRPLSYVRVYADRLLVCDLNRDSFELRGVGYSDADIVPLLAALNIPFNPDTIHDPPPGDHKELRASRRYPWAQDRAM